MKNCRLRTQFIFCRTSSTSSLPLLQVVLLASEYTKSLDVWSVGCGPWRHMSYDHGPPKWMVGITMITIIQSPGLLPNWPGRCLHHILFADWSLCISSQAFEASNGYLIGLFCADEQLSKTVFLTVWPSQLYSLRAHRAKANLHRQGGLMTRDFCVLSMSMLVFVL